MAANYWESTQYKYFLVDDPYSHSEVRYDLKRINKDDLILLHAYFATLLSKIGKQLSIRQKHIATSIVYFKRFYLRNSFSKTEPFLVLITCMYVAGKVDEYPYHLTNVLSESINVLKTCDPKISIQYEAADIAKFEFYLLETLNCRLTVFHPYHPFAEYVEKYLKSVLKDPAQQQAWNIINDCFRFDLVLSYPPHIIAVTAIYLCIAQNYEASGRIKNVVEDRSDKQTHPNPLKSFFLNSDIDFEQVLAASQKLLNYYELWQSKGARESNMLNILKFLHDSNSAEPNDLLQRQHQYVRHLQKHIQNNFNFQ